MKDKDVFEEIERSKKKVEGFFRRWNSLIHKKEAVSILYPNVKCPNLFFQERLQWLEEDDMELFMLELECKDDEIYTVTEQLKRGPLDGA